MVADAARDALHRDPFTVLHGPQSKLTETPQTTTIEPHAGTQLYAPARVNPCYHYV